MIFNPTRTNVHLKVLLKVKRKGLHSSKRFCYRYVRSSLAERQKSRKGAHRATLKWISVFIHLSRQVCNGLDCLVLLVCYVTFLNILLIYNFEQINVFRETFVFPR